MSAAALLLLLLSAATARAAPRQAETALPGTSFFPVGSRYDPSVPDPEGFLGYRIGDRVTEHAAMRCYLETLAGSSDRVALRSYGRSIEGRQLFYIILSDPDNMARIERIRGDVQRLADPRSSAKREIEKLVASTPAVVWLAYGVHGNEHSSTEAAMATAYHLAAGRDQATLEQLRNVVVIIDPVQNPDGRARFIAYERQVAGEHPRVDRNAAEHDEPWPSGRFNHALFDLNRDWFFRTQPETRGKVTAYLEWLPQVYVDLHEMDSDSTYYFPPPADPINSNIPASIRKWWGIFGNGNAAAFDAAGFDYYTAESFDEYYPGYGDSWPTLQGAVGMTYEQASARGLAVRRHDGTLLTLRDAVRHHFTASLSTVATAAAHRAELLRDFHRFRREAIEAGRQGPVRAYLIPMTVPATARRLASLLAGQGVEVLRAEEDFSVRVRSYWDSSRESRRFAPGTFIVPLAQPAGRLVNALMEADPELSDKFISQEKERRRLKEQPGFYDVTSWSLPIVVGAEAYWTADRTGVRTARVPLADAGPPAGGITYDARSGTSISPSRDGVYAYLIEYEDNASARAIIALLQTPLSLRVAGRPFRIGKHHLPPGSVIIRTHGNPPSVHEIVGEQARRFGVTIHAVSTGRTDEGIDLGSEHVVPLRLPRVAVAYGPPTSPTSLGAILYMFDDVYRLPYTPIRPTRFRGADLSDYDVIILPDAEGHPGYAGFVGEKGLARLKTWVDAGGTLITIKSASAYAAHEKVDLVPFRRLHKPGDALGPSNDSKEKTAEEPEEPFDVPGAILRVLVEPSRPLGFGYGRRLAVPVNSNLVFPLTKKGFNVVTFAPKEHLRLAGFAWEESLELLGGKAFLIDEPRGRGHIILFADDPNFRGYWESLNRMFLNGVLFSPAFSAIASP